MSAAARDIQNRVYDHLEFIRTNPDRKIIDWTNTEYALFRAIEHARYGDAIATRIYVRRRIYHDGKYGSEPQKEPCRKESGASPFCNL